MATLIRSDVTLSNPLPGSLLLPPLGVSGITHRWHAEAVAGNPGSIVAEVPDSVGGVSLATLSGTVLLGAGADGKRYLDFSSGTGDGNFQNRIYGGAAGDSNAAFTLAGLIYWDKPPTTQGAYGVINTGNASSTQALSVDAWNNRISAYGGASGTIVSTAPSTRKGWHTAIITYRANGNETLSLDGGTVASGEVHDKQAAAAVNSFGISGRPEQNLRVMDAAFFNRALTDAEHRIVHTALLKQLSN